MATYKVPQDVEADDKLLGPFSFRQFIYLMIILGLFVLAYGLFQLFPLLAVIPLPLIIFLEFSLYQSKRDQPMETYLAALVSFYTKPNKRYWIPGQSESTILITAPKQVEDVRSRNIAPEDASHRLSFLAELVDSEGHAIKNASTTMKDEFYAEAYNTTDMFEQSNNYGYGNMMMATQPQDERRNAIIDQMRDSIENSDYNYESRIAREGTIQLPGQRVLQPREGFTGTFNDYLPSGAPGTISGFESPTVVQPIFTPPEPITPTTQPGAAYNDPTVLQNNTIELRQNPARPPENIQQQADRIRQENESEVFVSLH